MTLALIKEIENFLHTLVTDVDTAIQPGVAYLKANVPAEAIKLGEAVLAGAVTGTPWASLVTALISQAEAAGITLAEQAAGIVLNYAQSNLLATGALPPVVVPVSPSSSDAVAAPIPAPDSAPEAAQAV